MTLRISQLVYTIGTKYQRLVDKHAPFADVKIRSHHNAPWYDDECRTVKCRTRRLERIYRDKKSEPDRVAWHAQTRHQRFIFNEKYVLYWSAAIKHNTGDPKALWSKVSALLKAPTGVSSSASTHTADDFAAYFKNKVDVIRTTTSSAPPPSIEERPCSVLSGMRMVTTTEITKIISCSPTKHCSLDPALTWLVERTLSLLSHRVNVQCIHD